MLSNKSPLLKLIGEESRLRLLSILSKNSYCVSDLITETGLSQSLISHHLRDLRDGGLVKSERDGKWMNYSLTAKGRRIISKQILNKISLLKLIADESRLELLSVLNNKSHCVSDLITETGLSQSLISHHLRDLRDSNLVRGLRNGKWINYALVSKGRQIMSVLGGNI
jgi:DNA-binding transcriptional ArsR family regulator